MIIIIIIIIIIIVFIVIIVIIVMIIQVGESPSLECDYSLAGENLYSIKWYKDQQEFYRFTLPRLIIFLEITIFQVPAQRVPTPALVPSVWYRGGAVHVRHEGGAPDQHLPGQCWAVPV